MVGSSATARYLGLPSPLPVWRRFSDREKNANLQFDSRKRRTVVTLFGGDGGDERAFHHDLLAEAASAAAIRFNESLRPDPLLIDLYAGCLISSDVPPGDGGEEQHPAPVASSSPCHYTLATRFIDDKILSVASGADAVKQIVLFSDGFDTRPYRIKWPPRASIYDVSRRSVFNTAREKLESAGAKILRNCKHIHVPSDSSDLTAALQGGGFHGGSPSLWVIQGFPVATLEEAKEILSLVSNLAVKGSTFLGEFPTRLADAERGNMWMEKIFTSHGFAVKTIDYGEVARGFQRSPPTGDYKNFLFVAEQLRFSDEQIEGWRREFMRIEDEGDEDGFEDLF